jgi:subtilisin family serine protease
MSGKLRLHHVGAALSVGLLTVIGCRDRQPTAPQIVRSSLAALSDTRPFYYYHGSPQYLDIDSTGFVFASQLTDPTSAARDALSPLAISQVARMPQLPDHWVVRLQGNATPAAYAADLTRLRADSRFGFVSSLYRDPQSHGPLTLLARLMVRFKAGVSRQSVDSLASALGMQITRAPKPDSGVFYFVFSYPRGSDPLQIAALMGRLPFVDWADPDKVADRHLDSPGSSEPYFSRQWYLQNTYVYPGNGVRVDNNAQAAWTYTTGNNSRLVAIFDDGIDGQQTDYMCAYYSWLWGYDGFSNQYLDGPFTPYPGDHHGTAVAGIINACFNSVGIAGIAPGVQLASFRIFRNNGQYAGDQAVADGISYAWSAANADVLSNSWSGGTPSQAIDDAIHNAATLGRGGKGSVVVFSAGNSSNRAASLFGSVEWPATLADVIAVGAIDSTGRLANYTPRGSQLALVALSSSSAANADPCSSNQDILTTDRPENSCNNGPNRDPNYTYSFGGTSAAAPQVAAAAALMLSVNPSLTQQQVRSTLLSTADAWPPYAAVDVGSGKLNIGLAVNNALPPPPPPPSVSVTINGPGTVPARHSCTWNAVATGGTEPYTYSWTVNGNPSGDGSDTLTITTPSSAFTIAVTATDANSLQGSTSVSVGIGGTTCNAQ